MKQLAIAAIILSFATAGLAAAQKARKPVVCENFTIATTTDGAKFGVCGATKPGGKMIDLRTYQVVSVIDPDTEQPVKVLVGFR